MKNLTVTQYAKEIKSLAIMTWKHIPKARKVALIFRESHLHAGLGKLASNQLAEVKKELLDVHNVVLGGLGGLSTGNPQAQWLVLSLKEFPLPSPISRILPIMSENSEVFIENYAPFVNDGGEFLMSCTERGRIYRMGFGHCALPKGGRIPFFTVRKMPKHYQSTVGATGPAGDPGPAGPAGPQGVCKCGPQGSNTHTEQPKGLNGPAGPAGPALTNAKENYYNLEFKIVPAKDLFSYPVSLSVFQYDFKTSEAVNRFLEYEGVYALLVLRGEVCIGMWTIDTGGLGIFPGCQVPNDITKLAEDYFEDNYLAEDEGEDEGEDEEIQFLKVSGKALYTYTLDPEGFPEGFKDIPSNRMLKDKVTLNILIAYIGTTVFSAWYITKKGSIKNLIGSVPNPSLTRYVQDVYGE